MKRLLSIGSLVLLTIMIGVAPTPALAAACGTERWSVKTGTDPDASSVNVTTINPTTIANLFTLIPPATLPNNNRISPTEKTVFSITATLIEYKIEADSDYHLVISDDRGQTMIVEIPSPSCIGAASPFTEAIARARATFDGKFTATGSFQHVTIPIKVTGVGFFDRIHGQTGVAPNGIELHPVLDIVFNPGAEPATPATVEPVEAEHWQYRIITASTAEALITQLNNSSAEGWELVSVTVDAQRPDRYVAFQRRLQE